MTIVNPNFVMLQQKIVVAQENSSYVEALSFEEIFHCYTFLVAEQLYKHRCVSICPKFFYDALGQSELWEK